MPIVVRRIAESSVPELPSVAAARYREASSTLARHRARGALHAALVAVCAPVVRGRGLSGLEASHLTHEIASRVLPMIETGRVAAGQEDHYARRAAANAVARAYRDKSGVHRRVSLDDAARVLVAEGTCTESQLIAREELAEAETRRERLRAAIAHAPLGFHEMLVHVYLEARPIGELVEIVLVRRGEPVTDELARRRARQTVDKTLQRAREWLARAIVGPLTRA